MDQGENSFLVYLAVEGDVDEAVARRILEYVDLPHYLLASPPNGKAKLLENMPKYNEAAKWNRWFVLVDLDQKPECAPDLIQTVLPKPSKGMRFRVAVRAMEAWLLADTDHLSDFLHVPQTKFPANPDAELNPKVSLVNLARHSTREEIRKDMVPREGSGGSVGPGYTDRLREFVITRWRPEAAVERSDSLRRCIAALQTLKNWN